MASSFVINFASKTLSNGTQILRNNFCTGSLLRIREGRSIVMIIMSVYVSVSLSVCLSVCLSACVARKAHCRTSPNVTCMLPVAVARFSSDDIAICYALPVFWMTSYFSYNGPHDGVMLPQQPRRSVMHGLTSLLRDIGCAKARRVLAKGAGANYVMHHCFVSFCQ